MDIQRKLSVLKKIAAEFNHARITWALGASMLLYFKGITDAFHDIDLMVTNEDADAARQILARLGQIQRPGPNEKYQTKLFLEFVIDGVDVDMMAGFAIVHCGRVYDCSLYPEQIKEVHLLDGVPIPLQSLGLWREYYQLMGRERKVEMISSSEAYAKELGLHG